MLTSAIRLFFVAMLSRQMGKHGVVFNLKLEGHKETFIVGDRRYVPVCTIVFKNLLTLGIFARSPRLMTFAKLYIDGYIDGEGDWFALARIVNELGDEKPSIIGRLITLLAPTTQSIDVHYGWSAEAFALFLDQPYMQYTCGRLSGDDSANLEQAQLNKLELITRWLKLKHGQRHLDVGCGWGGLMKFFADHYSTTSHGVTLSAEQVDYAHRLDLSSSTEFFITGFEGHVPDEPYDVATVVGMLEHVPITRHPEFFAWLADRMNVDGRVYLQCIIRNPARTAGDRTRFLNQFVFTHELSTLDEIRRMASKAGFEVVEVEEGHEDYAFTTRHWVERIRAHETEIRRLLDDDRVYRILLVKQS